MEFTWQAWTRRYMETGLMMDHPEQDINVIVFYCCHAYHLSCLEGGLDLMRSNSNQDSDNESDDEDGSPSGGSRMRCVLCTTAAA